MDAVAISAAMLEGIRRARMPDPLIAKVGSLEPPTLTEVVESASERIPQPEPVLAKNGLLGRLIDKQA